MNTFLSGGRNGCCSNLCTMGGTITTDATRLYNGGVVVCVLLSLFFSVTMTTAAVPPTTTTLTEEQGQVNICERNGCNCTTIAHDWINGSCIFHDSQVVEVAAKALPSRLMELHIQGAREVRLLAEAFSNLRNLRLVSVSNVHQLRVRKHAFINGTWNHVRMVVHDCALAVLETHAFRYSKHASVNISRCAHVVLQGETFAWLLALEIRTVARLQLASYAFSLTQPDGRRHGSPTTVLLQNVVLAEIPQNAFPSLMAEVRFVDAHIRTVRRDAFYAITFSVVVFVNTSLQVVEAGAFSERTLVNNLELRGVHIGVLAAHAIKAAVNNLTIQHSNVSEVESGAVNITVAKVTLRDSYFENIRTRGFVFSNWDCIQMEDNTIEALEPDGLIAPFQQIPGVTSYDFTFTGNQISELRSGSLAFVTRIARAQEESQQSGLTTQVGGNLLTQLCHCELFSWLEDNAALIDSSKCAVDEVLALCLGVPQGWVSVRNYSDLVCVQRDVIMCDTATSEMTRDPAFPPAAAPADRERKVLALIFVVVVLCIIAILTVTGVLWLRRKGYCLATGFLTIPTTTASCIAMLTRLIDSGVATATTRTASQEYTELQQQQQHRVTVDDGEASENGDFDDDEAPSEDKWTQTLPEELTQELLQQLREKLDDPENYSEARDMIEHLYDLIKVEESCSNNNKTIVPLDLDDYEGENVYDVIQPSSPAPGRSRKNKDSPKKQVCSVGTRAPSPDKLLPATTYAQMKVRRQAPVMCEYVEPRDRQQHLYTEVLGGNVPPPPASPKPETSSPTRRPLSFLRVLGESLQFVSPRSSPSGAATMPMPPPRPSATALSPTSTAPNTALSPDASLLCEYAEPTDAAVHVYSELPPAAAAAAAAAKMVNRPLPNKPGQQDDGGGDGDPS